MAHSPKSCSESKKLLKIVKVGQKLPSRICLGLLARKKRSASRVPYLGIFPPAVLKFSAELVAIFSLIFIVTEPNSTLIYLRNYHHYHCHKPATHLAILYADRRDRRKSPSVPGAAIAIFRFSDRRYPTCQISTIKFAGNRLVCLSRDFLRTSPRIASKVSQSGWAILSHDFSK